MNRRCFVTNSAFALLGLTALRPADALVPEPTYTATLPGNQVISLRMESVKYPDGRRRVRVWNQPKSVAKSDLQIDTTMVVEADGKPSSSRIFFGINPDQGMSLEAIRNTNGFITREPALSGDLQFGASLFVPLIAELFIGKLYDFKRGGPQTFARFIDALVTTAKIDTLVLTAEGGPETIELPDGPVKARKLRYQLKDPAIPESQQTGVFYVGPSGEVLRCDTPFFGVPLRAKGAAAWEENGTQLTLRFKNPDSGNRVAALQAKKAAGGWKVTLRLEDVPTPLAALTCDTSYRLIRMETPWHGRPFVASAVGPGTIHWTLAGGPEQQTDVAPGSPVWFLPHWFATDLWEGQGGAFAGMIVNETRDGSQLALFLGQRNAVLFTLERLADTSALRRYRFYTGGKQAVPGAPAPVYELYTDGSRLVAFLTSDNIRIVRTGWETFAKALPAPVVPAPAPVVNPEP